MPRTVLAIVPHPDDAEFAAGGLLARFAQEGARVVTAIATDGSVGGPPGGAVGLAERRAEEAREAARRLGAAEPIFLGYPDFRLERTSPADIRERIVRLIRQVRPDVLVLQDPTVFDPHPDHRALATAACEAANFSQLPLLHPEHFKDGLEPWFVPEKYYYSDDNPAATFIIDIGAFLQTKINAVLAHESQVEFLVADVLGQARAAAMASPEAAARVRAALSEAGLGDGTPEAVPAQVAGSLLAWSVERTAAEIGRRGGFTYGEAFRRVGFHPYIEAMLH